MTILAISKYWKHVLVAIVLIASWAALLNTETITSDPPWRYLEALYDSIILFVIGGIDIGFPHGNSRTAVIILWICYFLAPLLSASFIYQVVQEKIFSRLSPWLRGHTIICGIGRNGKLIYHLVKEYSPKRHKIVIIEKDIQNAFSEVLEKDPLTWWLKNDFTLLPVLQKAGVKKAKRVYITTNHDIANLNAMVEIQDIKNENDEFALHCHLGDLNLHANFGATLFKEDKFSSVHLFNGYHCVTRRLYHDWIINQNLLNPDGNIFAILGFGRFGQMLYNHLVSDEKRGTDDEIIIATLKANFELDRLQYSWALTQQNSNCKIHTPLYQDIHSPALWDKLARLSHQTNKQLMIFICRDNDIANLNLAISMKRDGPEEFKKSTIFCRMYSRTATDINEILERRITKTKSRDIILFPMEEELKEAFRGELFG